MTNDPYAPYGPNVKLYPAKGAGWTATTGRIEQTNALGVTLSYSNPVNKRFTTTSTFPLSSIDRIEYIAVTSAIDHEIDRETDASIAEKAREIRADGQLEIIASASEELAERNGEHTRRGIREVSAA
ncbi:hypothetical protein [Microbacterium murale]|uniref:Uncharacterized protein n=1 Tax=Microbacterium murale TaxID=1081040 RepID=A0ABU0PFF1_9MICO|nr:hypothetical protein [Microbacterium murale]MDQ0645652.1 hypothetical protein [Microbacterium murale]